MKSARAVYIMLRRTSGSIHISPPPLRVAEHPTIRTMPEDSAYASGAQDDETATDGSSLAQDIRLVRTVIESCAMTRSKQPHLRSSAEHLSRSVGASPSSRTKRSSHSRLLAPRPRGRETSVLSCSKPSIDYVRVPQRRARIYSRSHNTMTRQRSSPIFRP